MCALPNLNQLYSINIPTKPYLAKFIAYRYGAPVILNESSSISYLIRSQLKTKSRLYLATYRKADQIAKLTGNVLCIMQMAQVRMLGAGITSDGIIMLNRYWDKDFEEYLYEYCRLRVKKDTRYVGYKNILEQFAFDIGLIIDEDITMDCLTKTEYRTRQKNLSKIYTENVRSIKPPITAFESGNIISGLLS